MNRNVIETITGAIVLGVAIWFLVIFMNKATDINLTKSNYSLMAKFENADGITSGSFVKIGGVKIGVVTGQSLDPNNYSAILNLSIDQNVKIPNDSSAKIVSDGLLGGKYISVVPGGSEKNLNDKEEILYTQSSVNLESLIGKMIFNSSNKDKKEEAGGANSE